MIAIVYYDETELINIISILISLLSVAAKSLIFSKAIIFSVFIFNWLSIVTDFFGIFCSLSWVFYNPNDSQTLTKMGTFWINQSVTVWAAICVWTVVTLAIPKVASDLFDDRQKHASTQKIIGMFVVQYDY